MPENYNDTITEEEIKGLLLRISLGEEAAFTRIVNLYWDKVYGHAMAYAKSSPRAQELAQDVFLQLWQKREKLTEVNNFKSYLFILGRNQIVSSMRKKLLEPSTNDPGELIEELLQPDQQLQFKETYTSILQGIEKLPPARKKIFKMSRLEGMSYDEIARVLNISRNAVKGHIVLALNFLRTYLHIHSDKMPTVALLACLLLGNKMVKIL